MRLWGSKEDHVSTDFPEQVRLPGEPCHTSAEESEHAEVKHIWLGPKLQTFYCLETAVDAWACLYLH